MEVEKLPFGRATGWQSPSIRLFFFGNTAVSDDSRIFGELESFVKFLLLSCLGMVTAASAFGNPLHNDKPAADPRLLVKCNDQADAARVDYLKDLPDGRVEFKISTYNDSYQGVANPLSPKHSIEKQVLALEGKRYFCLVD